MSLDRVSRGPIRRPLLHVEDSGGWVHLKTYRQNGCTVYFARLLRWSMHEADSRHRSDLLIRGTLAFGCWTLVQTDGGPQWRWDGGSTGYAFFADRWGMTEGCRLVVVTHCRGRDADALRIAVRKVWADWGLDCAPAPVPPHFRAPGARWCSEHPTARPACPVFLPQETDPASAPTSGDASTPASAACSESEQKRTKAICRDEDAERGHPRERRTA